jgi:beta-glucosidase
MRLDEKGIIYSMNKISPYQDSHLSFEERAKDLVTRMTLDEKVPQMLFQSPAGSR